MGQPSQVASKFAGKRLLIVDDETDMRLLLAEYFRRLGFQVEERESGAALEPAPRQVDCFIFDVDAVSPASKVEARQERGGTTQRFLTSTTR